MHKLIVFFAVLIMPLTAHAEDYNPAAPSKGAKAISEAAKESVLPAPVKTPPKTPAPPIDVVSPLPTTDKGKFEYYDIDNSGSLSYKEFMRYSGRTKAQDAGFRKRFLRIDTNGDYQLTSKELKNWAE